MSQVAELRAEAGTLGALVVAEMRLMYGAKFAQQWVGLTPRELRDSWDQKLIGLTEKDVRTGLVACLSRDWPPTLPEFLRLCRPWMEPEAAYQIAVAGMSARRKGELGAWPHPAVYWAAVKIGSHDLLSTAWSAIRIRWENALREQLARDIWLEVPLPLRALPAPGRTETTNEDGQRLAGELAGKLGAEAKRNPKRWARRILNEQQRKGGRRYTADVLTMARRALGMEQP